MPLYYSCREPQKYQSFSPRCIRMQLGFCTWNFKKFLGAYLDRAPWQERAPLPYILYLPRGQHGLRSAVCDCAGYACMRSPSHSLSPLFSQFNHWQKQLDFTMRTSKLNFCPRPRPVRWRDSIDQSAFSFLRPRSWTFNLDSCCGSRDTRRSLPKTVPSIAHMLLWFDCDFGAIRLVTFAATGVVFTKILLSLLFIHVLVEACLLLSFVCAFTSLLINNEFILHVFTYFYFIVDVIE